MTRFAIDRKNRDRRGGHQAKDFTGDAGVTSWTQEGKAVLKRIGKRKVRRQHAKAIAEAMQEYHEELMHPIFSDDSNYELIDSDEYENFSEELDEDDGIYLDHRDMESDYSPWHDTDDWIAYLGSDAPVQPEPQVVHRAVAWVTDPHFDAELEIIENRDAGKSLGQLLRERIQGLR